MFWFINDLPSRELTYTNHQKNIIFSQGALGKGAARHHVVYISWHLLLCDKPKGPCKAKPKRHQQARKGIQGIRYTYIYIMIFVCSKCKHIHTMLIFRFHDFKLAIQHLISGSPDIWEKRVVHIGFWNHKMPQGRGSKCSAYEQRGWGRRKKCATTTRGNHFWLGCHMAVMKRDSCWLVERHCNWSTWSERLWVMMNMPSLKLL